MDSIFYLYKFIFVSFLCDFIITFGLLKWSIFYFTTSTIFYSFPAEEKGKAEATSILEGKE